MQKKCFKCNQIVSDRDIYCAKCGSNVKMQEKIQDSKESFKPITLNTNLLIAYQEVDSKIRELGNIEIEHQQQINYHNRILQEFQEAQQFYNHKQFQTKKELKDVENLKKMTWTSIKARIKGKKEDLIKKEEIEYLDSLNREEAAKKDLEELQNRLSLAKSQLNEVNQLVNQKKALENQLVEIIDSACEGVPDPIEDQIENDLRDLYKQKHPLSTHHGRLNESLSHLSNARYNFDRALNNLNSARGYSDWDTFFGGGFFVDSMKHSKMADARNWVQQAHRSLERARALVDLPGIGGAHVEEGSFFWDTFMDNFFSDMHARGQINRSRESVRQVLFQTNNAIQNIESQINSINKEFQQIENRILNKRVELTRERRRMIEDALSRKK
jgi:hypothetical protein